MQDFPLPQHQTFCVGLVSHITTRSHHSRAKQADTVTDNTQEQSRVWLGGILALAPPSKPCLNIKAGEVTGDTLASTVHII